MLNKLRLQAIAHVRCLRCMCAVKLFFLCKKSSPATATTMPKSRAFQRCVVSTGMRFLGPQHQARRACASYCPRALHVRSETFFSMHNKCVEPARTIARARCMCAVKIFFLCTKKQPSHCHPTAGLTGFPTMRREHRYALFRPAAPSDASLCKLLPV